MRVEEPAAERILQVLSYQLLADGSKFVLIICKFYFEQLHSNSVAKKLSDNFVGVSLLRVFLLTFRERGIYLVLK